MEIYIKSQKKVQVVERQLVYLKDIAEIYVNGTQAGTLGDLVILKIPEKSKKTYLVSIIDVIKGITNLYPKASVINVGETDVVIDYEPKARKENKWVQYVKVGFVGLILAAGASTTIMCFHTDCQIPRIFENYYYMFFGENNNMPMIISIPYSVGLGLGIIIFFNHFSKFYLTQDPTPIEVEMTTYETETITNIVNTLTKKENQSIREKS